MSAEPAGQPQPAQGDLYGDLAHDVRRIADLSWQRGLKDICTRLHDIAREIEHIGAAPGA